MGKGIRGVSGRCGDRFHRAELTRAKLATLCLAFGLLLVAVAGAGVAGAEQGDSTPEPSAALPIGPDAVPLDENIANLEVANELPHRDLGREESLQLAQGVFGTQLESAAGIFDDLQVAKFLSKYTAVIPPGAAPDPSGQVIGGDGGDLSPDQPFLLESSLPLRVEDGSGNPQPVDLGLERSEGELQRRPRWSLPRYPTNWVKASRCRAPTSTSLSLALLTRGRPPWSGGVTAFIPTSLRTRT
jgi:hypothetical protein